MESAIYKICAFCNKMISKPVLFRGGLFLLSIWTTGANPVMLIKSRYSFNYPQSDLKFWQGISFWCFKNTSIRNENSSGGFIAHIANAQWMVEIWLSLDRCMVIDGCFWIAKRLQVFPECENCFVFSSWALHFLFRFFKLGLRFKILNCFEFS